MKLVAIAEQIIKAAPEQMLSVQELYASLDFRGPRNAHLAIPEWHTEEFRTSEMQRHEFLSGNEEITGDFLVFRYNLDGEMVLLEFATLGDAGQFVVGGAGVFNGFTRLALVFDHFRLCHYRVSFLDHTGARIIFDGTHEKDDRPFPGRQIEWLELAS